jgi:large subunit ribosomal protein L10
LSEKKKVSMDNPRAEKVAVVDEVRARLDASSAAILTEYRGLTVKDVARLRDTLRPIGGTYKIYKNTLVRFAARDLGIEGLDSLLEGPTAIAFVDGDAAAVAKALRDFARANPILIVKGGVLGTTVLSAGETSALADLPSREVLLARLAGGLAAPMQRFAGLLQALPRNFAYGLKALIDQGGAPGGASTTASPEADAEEPVAAAEPAAQAEEAAPEPVAEAEEAAPEPVAEAESEPAVGDDSAG